MKKYLVLYKSDAALTGPSVSEMFAEAPPEKMAAGMAAWQVWYEKSGPAVLDVGAPLDNAILIAGGFAAPVRSDITGYTFLEAESGESAAALLLQGHPHFHLPGTSVQILECIAMPGM